jgi:hypothetical protein
MTETDDAGVPADVVDAFERHDAFDAVDDDRFALDTTAFDVLATASATDDERAGSFTVTMAVPTLSASVADADDVADVVEDGWFETFERRMADAYDVAKTSDGTEPSLDRGVHEVDVELTYESWTARDGVADAKALAEYVEGTFLQGLVPGYDYVGVAADLRSAATQNAQGAESGDRSGTPL